MIDITTTVEYYYINIFSKCSLSDFCTNSSSCFNV